jgi:hypothetical protein
VWIANEAVCGVVLDLKGFVDGQEDEDDEMECADELNGINDMSFDQKLLLKMSRHGVLTDEVFQTCMLPTVRKHIQRPTPNITQRPISKAYSLRCTLFRRKRATKQQKFAFRFVIRMAITILRRSLTLTITEA